MRGWTEESYNLQCQRQYIDPGEKELNVMLKNVFIFHSERTFFPHMQLNFIAEKNGCLTLFFEVPQGSKQTCWFN